jgi:hypothetical protein
VLLNVSTQNLLSALSGDWPLAMPKIPLQTHYPIAYADIDAAFLIQPDIGMNSNSTYGTRWYRSDGTTGAIEANPRLAVGVDGKLTFGRGGANALSTNLYESAADTLKTDDKLLAVGGIGVGNSVAATTPGSVTRKMEVFDASGASLGFVPIYAAIT